MAENPTIGMFVGDDEIERRKRQSRNEDHGECPWCLAHPHRDACSLNCARARRAKAEDDLARVQMGAHNQHHE